LARRSKRKAETATEEAWNRFSDAGRALLVGSAVVIPAWRKDYRTSFNALAAILAASVASKVIKSFWHEPRPDGENDKSFPSQHAADCFAAATILRRNGDAGPAAIGLATAVSAARVFGGKHHVADVVAGASLGIIVAETISAWNG
jgi:membrane-associated phospholipid phosphatase